MQLGVLKAEQLSNISIPPVVKASISIFPHWPVDRNSSNFMFRCHRFDLFWLLFTFLRERNNQTKGENISSVNAIAFAPQNTFLTAGSDGVIAYWDKNSRYQSL